MKLLTILWVIFSKNLKCLTEETAPAQDHHLSCINDYLRFLTCELTMDPYHLPEDNAQHWLEFWEMDSYGFPRINFTCLLRKAESQYKCTYETEEDKSIYVFNDITEYAIKLYTEQNGHKNEKLLLDNYAPNEHIKLIAPFNLTIYRLSMIYYFTWECGYKRISDFIQFQLVLFKSGHQKSVNEFLPQNNTYYIREESLESDTEYSVMVRSIPHHRDLKGEWSEWSRAVRWKTRTKQDGKMHLIWQASLPLCVVVLLVVLLTSGKRLKVIACSKVPTPAPYFQPLYNIYRGNLQSWLVYPNNLETSFKLDEPMKIDTLIVVKPVSHEEKFLPPTFHPEQNQNHMQEWPRVESPHSLGSLSRLKSSSEEILHPSYSEGDSGWEDVGASLDDSNIPSQEQESPNYNDNYCTMALTQQGLVPIFCSPPSL